ncbi:MAG: type II/IV secretion system protein [Alphaproteobacteria bacterium]|nr:type II/IV secretion system protein [Alphaproteobacteria bacterium]
MGNVLQKREENYPTNIQKIFSHFQAFRSPTFQASSDSHIKHSKLGEWLINQKWITSDQLIVALKEQSRGLKRLGEIVLELGFITPLQLLKALSALSGLPFISLSNQILSLSIVQKIPLKIAQDCKLILFHEDEKGAHIALADPENILALDMVRTHLGTHVSLIPYHTTLAEIEHALEVYYPQPTLNTEEGQTIRLVNDLILEAVRLKASDIHLSPTGQSVDIHYRQDGILCRTHTFHKDRWSSILVRLKIMANVDIAESRRPQNGRFSLTMGGREIDFRLSCHPTIHGENLVVRILDKAYSLRSLEELGFEKNDIEIIKRLVNIPQGLIILSGPTGSGKTTTLYALLSHMDALSRNIMTLEEPVEYYLPNIRQTEIREDGPIRFGEGIRSILRQDPDVIFVSEIRDSETAQMAIRAAMTGHLVLATIHARDSFSVPQRFVDLGVSPSLLSGNLVASIAQRLVRKLCKSCRHLTLISKENIQEFCLSKKISHAYQKGACEQCYQTGYRGREAIAELVLFDENFSTLIAEGKTQAILRQTWKERGGSTLWERGIEKVLTGDTSLQELNRVIGINH